MKKAHASKLVAAAFAIVCCMANTSSAQEIVTPEDGHVSWITDNIFVGGNLGSTGVTADQVQIRLQKWMFPPFGGPFREWVTVDTVGVSSLPPNGFVTNFYVGAYPMFGDGYDCGNGQSGWGWLGLHRVQLFVSGQLVQTNQFRFVHDCAYGPTDPGTGGDPPNDWTRIECTFGN